MSVTSFAIHLFQLVMVRTYLKLNELETFSCTHVFRKIGSEGVHASLRRSKTRRGMKLVVVVVVVVVVVN